MNQQCFYGRLWKLWPTRFQLPVPVYSKVIFYLFLSPSIWSNGIFTNGLDGKLFSQLIFFGSTETLWWILFSSTEQPFFFVRLPSFVKYFNISANRQQDFWKYLMKRNLFIKYVKFVKTLVNQHWALDLIWHHRIFAPFVVNNNYFPRLFPRILSDSLTKFYNVVTQFYLHKRFFFEWLLYLSFSIFYSLKFNSSVIG